MSRKRGINEMKKGIIAVMIMFLMGCSSETIQSTPEPTETATTGVLGCGVEEECDDGERADMSGYEGFTDEEHVFVSATMSEVNSYFEKDETFVVYFGFSSCPWCKEAAPILNDIAKEFDRRVLYVDTRLDGDDIRVETNSDYVQLMELVQEYVEKDESGNEFLYVPAVYFVKDGEVVSYNIGTVGTHDATERVMTEEEVELLKVVYRSGFELGKK